MLERRIICPVDFSPGSQHALGIAVRIANDTNAALVVSGPPTEHVLDLALPSDLIVMGTHRSVAAKVVRHARCAVLVARPYGDAGPYAHILVPVDFSECSRRALDEAGDLAVQNGATLTLLHVLERASEADDDTADAAVDQLDAWGDIAEARAPTCVTRVVRTGNPVAQTVAMVIEDPSIDLVVVGSHGRTGLARMLIGSVAEQLVRRAKRPVLVVH